MTWADNQSNIKTFIIQSDTEKSISKDLKNLFSEITEDEFNDCSDILIYVDATNGNLFISGFDSNTDKVYDNKGIYVQLTEFWEKNQNAYDFDEIIKTALKTAYHTSEKTLLKSKYEVFYQTEDEREFRRL
jgi:hypothetical protein